MLHRSSSRISPESAEASLAIHLREMASDIADEVTRAAFQAEMQGFSKLYSAFVRAGNRFLDWGKIRPPPEDRVIHHAALPSCPSERIGELLNKLVVLKLNGGLGTTMGCTGPKSVIEVHSGRSFLDLTVRQIEHLNTTYSCSVPLVLMNSFNTDEETLEVISKYNNTNVPVHCFNQHRYPRIYKDTLLPVPEGFNDPKESWCPPGHGDVFSAFHQSPLFQQLAAQGKTHVFISNIDNLGATVDLGTSPHILNNPLPHSPYSSSPSPPSPSSCCA